MKFVYATRSRTSSSIFLLVFCFLFLTSHFSEATQNTEVQNNILRLEEMDLSNMVQGWGEPGVKKTILDKPLTINGTQFKHGVGTHANSRLTVDLKGNALKFRAMVGLDDETAEKNGSVLFQVYADKKKVFSSGVLRFGDGPKEIDVDLRGVQRLDLEILDGGDTIDYDHADWADAYLVLKPGTKTMPETKPRKTIPKEIRTPPVPDYPLINAPGVIGAGEKREFSYYIPITGERPINIKVSGLPEGIHFDRNSGMLFGKTPGASEWPLVIHAENAEGSDTREILLTVGDGLAKTPPMGWNSWNCWGSEVREENIREAAEAMVKTGLINQGFSYIVIDDTWEGERDAKTLRLGSNEKFPDMKDLADFIHSQGLKFGLYTDLGYKTCQGYEGSRGYEFLDADTFARWDVDYIKADWCYAHGMRPAASYKTLALAIDKTGRDMILSICTAGNGNPWEWGEEVGGNLWRTTIDIRDNWHSVYTNVSKIHYSLYNYAKPGHWNDPDMLVVGKVGWGRPLRDSGLSPNQQYSHISLWSLLSAPLILGCDLTQMDDFTLGLLTNDEVMAVNQDPLGKQARRLIQKDRFEVWVKELENGDHAVGIFNTAPTESDETASREFILNWEEIGIREPQSVRDLWRKKDLGVHEKSITATLPQYDVLFIRTSSIK